MSLRGSITLVTALTLTVGLALAGVALNLLLASRLMTDANAVLDNRAASLLATIDTSGSAPAVRDTAGDAVLDEQAWVFDLAGTAIERPPLRGKVADEARALARAARRTRVSVKDRARLLAVPIADDRGARVGTVVVGVSLSPYERTEHLAVLATILLCACVVVVAAALARRAVGRALRPVAVMTAQVADWSEHDLERRFNLGPPRDELTNLAATLNGLLSRITAVLRHEQRFSAEMAHELRTPLSGIRAEAELAMMVATDREQFHNALARILEGTDRMSTVMETLLLVARNEQAGSVGSSDAAAILRALEDKPEIDVSVPAGRMPVGVDQDLVTAALYPLLENARRHAREKVHVGLARDGDSVIVSVSNDGDEIPSTDAERIFEAGVSSTGGAGLGLALSRRLARAAGGDVTVAAPIPRFDLRLPVA